MNPKKKLKTAILGTGNIGTDLLIKVLRSPYLEASLFAGRRHDSPGIKRAKQLGIHISDKSIQSIIDNPDCCDLVFDATNAMNHVHHWSILKKMGKIVIDMTPSMVGKMIIPAINLKGATGCKNVNIVSCGGQAALPLIYAFAQTHQEITYIETVSSIASRSAGPSTRKNIDEYIENTERGIVAFSKCKHVKSILILNPAQPDIDMQTTVSMKILNPRLNQARKMIFDMERKIQSYVPGYKIIVPPVTDNNRVVMTVRIRGRGDYLPRYAGNLDIITCASIAIAEEYAKVNNGVN